MHFMFLFKTMRYPMLKLTNVVNNIGRRSLQLIYKRFVELSVKDFFVPIVDLRDSAYYVLKPLHAKFL